MTPEADNLLLSTGEMTVCKALDLGSGLFLTLEVALNTIAAGLLSLMGSYLRSDVFNRIDFAVLLSYWVQQVWGWAVAARGGDVECVISLAPFRLFRMLKPLTSLTFFFGVRTIFETLDKAFYEMIMVLYFFLLFLVTFAIFFVSLFHNSLTRLLRLTC